MSYPLVLYGDPRRRPSGSSLTSLRYVAHGTRVGVVIWISLNAKESLTQPARSSGSLDVVSQQIGPTRYHEQQGYWPRMSQSYTEEQIRQFEEDDLAAQRITKLSWGFHKIPTSVDHQNYLRSSREQRDAWKKRASSGSTFPQTAADFNGESDTSDLDTAEYRDDDDNEDELVYKWLWLRGPNADPNPYKVLRDTGSTSNWISRDAISQLGLEPVKTSRASYSLMVGKLESDEYVDVPWRGKEGRKGVARCRVAPPSAPFDGLLVGEGFLQKQSDAFFDEQPDRRLLLAIQDRPKKEESPTINANQERNDAEAAEVARRRRQVVRNTSRGSHIQSSKGEQPSGEKHTKKKTRG